MFAVPRRHSEDPSPYPMRAFPVPSRARVWPNGRGTSPVDCAAMSSNPEHPSARLRLGVFGGTFDPPHVGHLVTAVNVRHALNLDEVLMVVAHRPWQKESDRVVSPAGDRLAMVQAATAGLDGVTACALEIERGGISYTADTLAVLHERLPDAELFTIVGDDAAAGIETWERVDDVAALSTLVVVDRPGEHVALPRRFSWLRVEVPRLEVSSTDLRARCGDGRPLDFLVPPAVRQVIEQRGLYR